MFFYYFDAVNTPRAFPKGPDTPCHPQATGSIVIIHGYLPAAASQRAGDPQRRKLVLRADDGSEPDPKTRIRTCHDPRDSRKSAIVTLAFRERRGDERGCRVKTFWPL